MSLIEIKNINRNAIDVLKLRLGLGPVKKEKIPKKKLLRLAKKPLTNMKPRVGAPSRPAKSKPHEQSQDRSQNTLHENPKTVAK